MPLSGNQSLSEDARYNPDEHGGWEMGTWEFPNYLHVIKKALTPAQNAAWTDDGIRVGKPVGEGSGYWQHHIFSPEECARVVKYLSRKRKELVKGHVVVKWGYHWMFKKQPLYIHEKWHDHMIAMFKTGRVVYYSE